MDTVFVLKRNKGNFDEFIDVGKNEKQLILKAVKDLLDREVENITIERNNKEVGINMNRDVSTYIGTANKLEFVITVNKI